MDVSTAEGSTAPAGKPPRVSSQQARMLLSISTHGDPLAHCRTSSDYGGADGTLTSLHRHKLVTYVREARKTAPSTLVLTDLGRLALADHQRRNGGAELALTAKPPTSPIRRLRKIAREVVEATDPLARYTSRVRAATDVLEKRTLTQGEARMRADRVVRRYLRAQGGERAGFDYGEHERDLTAWITAEILKAGR